MVGSWLKAERERRGWSQAELARRAGLSRQAVGQLERNTQRQPYPDTVEALAHALDMSQEALYRAVYGDHPLPPQPPALFVPGELVSLWPRLGAADREAILQMARTLARSGPPDRASPYPPGSDPGPPHRVRPAAKNA